jgi:uncharacterized protein (TIGR03435 family)
MRHVIAAALTLALLESLPFAAQTTFTTGVPPAAAPKPGEPLPTFEVASVKPNKSADRNATIGFQPGGRFTASNIVLRTLIAAAYGTPQPLPAFPILNGPDWIASDRFDITAKAEGDPPPGPNGPMRPMLRSLLQDRFKLAVHMETRDLPTYELVLARSDGKLGPQLRPSTVDCEAIFAANRGRGAAFPPPPQPGEPPTCGMFGGPGRVSAGSIAVADLISMLSGRVARTIVDKTGLTGRFDLNLEFTPDQLPQGSPPPGAPPLPPIDPNGPSIFTALQEQLGLKLESRQGPVEVLVIDHVEQPTPD